MAAPRRRASPFRTIGLVLLAFGGGVLVGVGFEAPSIWLMSMELPVKTVELGMSPANPPSGRPLARRATRRPAAAAASNRSAPSMSLAPERTAALPAGARSRAVKVTQELPRPDAPADATASARAPLPAPDAAEKASPAAPPVRPAAELAATRGATPRAPVPAAKEPRAKAAPAAKPAAEKAEKAPARADKRQVQIATTPSREGAQDLVRKLRGKHLDAYLIGNRKIYKVFVRPTGQESAERIAERLEELGFDDTMIVGE